MKLKKTLQDNLVLIIGAVLFLSILLLPPLARTPQSYYECLKYTSATLKGKTPFSDFAAEVVSFRALYNRTEPYPVLGPALKDLGIDWDVVHPNSHPPTSFLFAAPVAFLPWPWASAIWAWLMLGLIVFSLRCYDLSWKKALGLMPLTLLWPPTSFALGQLTVLWLFFLSLAYYLRKRQLWSGVSIGLASATKLWAGIVLLIFVVKRKWPAVFGFILIWIVMLTTVYVLNSAAIPRYLVVSREVSSGIIHRTDNQSPIVASYAHGGWIGAVLMVLLLSLVLFVNRRYFYQWTVFPSTRAWMLSSYFSVALLPTSYSYALVPLLPVIVFLFWQKKIASAILAAGGILAPCFYVEGGEESVLPLVSVTVFVGLAFIVDTLPLKIFQKELQIAR